MNHYKSILYLFISTLFLGASCTQTATNTNTVSNTNENTSGEVAVNTNTPDESGEVDLSTDSSSEALAKEEASAEVDTSDPALSEVEGWLTYTNEEYGFSFMYPRDWGVNVIDENDEGGMGLSIGSIVISNSNCRAQGDEVRNGTIDSIKNNYLVDSSKLLIEISQNDISGIQYNDIVNENRMEGYVYIYLIGQKEFNFRVVDNPNSKDCQSVFRGIMETLAKNS